MKLYSNKYDIKTAENEPLWEVWHHQRSIHRFEGHQLFLDDYPKPQTWRYKESICSQKEWNSATFGRIKWFEVYPFFVLFSRVIPIDQL